LATVSTPLRNSCGILPQLLGQPLVGSLLVGEYHFNPVNILIHLVSYWFHLILYITASKLRKIIQITIEKVEKPMKKFIFIAFFSLLALKIGKSCVIE
jgi:hypothetical protein